MNYSISIILPVLNEIKSLEKTLNIINKIKVEKEFIIIFSNDLTQEIVKKKIVQLKKKYKNLKNVDLTIYNSITKLNRQFLHAKSLGFIHPRTKKQMFFSSILPKELNNILKMLRNTEE